jgi:hypothetical protein
VIQPLLAVERMVELVPGALTLVKPSPPKAVAGKARLYKGQRPRTQSPPAD